MAMVLSLLIITMPVRASEQESTQQSIEQEEDKAVSPPAIEFRGLWPQLSVLLRLPDKYQLRYPDTPKPPQKPVRYERKFPLFAQAVIDRGFALPPPWGISVIWVNNTQAQDISDISVALGKGIAPSPDTDLTDLPFVELNNVVSKTKSRQVKADLWLLPNVNIFASLGKVKGNVNLDVDIDMDAFLPPPICRPVNPCGVKRLNFDASVDASNTTLGLTAVHTIGNWYASGTISRSLTVGKKETSDIRATSGGLRLGRRWLFGDGYLLAPYFGGNYLDIDQIVKGLTRAPNTFPDGDTLEVRYKVKLENEDKWASVIGLNLGLLSGISIQGEYNKSSNSERFQMSMTYRF